MSTALHAAALEYNGRGWAVFPCQPRGKQPACARGFHDAVANDPTRINTWWGAFPNLNIGIATGAVSGFFVLDIDDDGGEASLRKLEEQHGKLPATIEAITGKGRHCYFRIGDHGAIKNSAGQIAPGLDIRGDGGYVLVPPSIHPSGRAYAWSVDNADSFADAPDWLHALIHADRAGNGAKGKPLEHWHQVLTNTIPDGIRDNSLTSICGKLIHAGMTDVMLLLDVMQCINIARCVPVCPPEDVEAIVANVLRCHLKRLRGDE
jgi:ferredoxin